MAGEPEEEEQIENTDKKEDLDLVAQTAIPYDRKLYETCLKSLERKTTNNEDRDPLSSKFLYETCMKSLETKTILKDEENLKTMSAPNLLEFCREIVQRIIVKAASYNRKFSETDLAKAYGEVKERTRGRASTILCTARDL